MTTPEDAIRARRRLTNKFIAERQAERLRPFLAPDAQLIPGGGGLITGADAIVAAYAMQFREPGFTPYVRTTERVEVAADQDRAAEHGRWDGFGMAGAYLAVWRRVTGQWVVETELFVTLLDRNVE